MILLVQKSELLTIFSGIWTQKKILFSTFAAQTHVDYEHVILSSKE